MKSQPEQPPVVRDLREDLRHVSHGDVVLYEAFQTLMRSQEEQARAAAELLEHETWALAAIVELSGAMWSQLPSQPLRFALDLPETAEQSHLELGRFSHLAALDAPSLGEHTLITATIPCFARVYPHLMRQAAGCTGPLACSYVPVSLAEAVATLGFARIVTEIELATRKAGHRLLSEAESQRERQMHLLRIERMLGWEPDPLADPVVGIQAVDTALVTRRRVQGQRRWLVSGTVCVAVASFLCGFLPGSPVCLLFLILVGAGIVIWKASPHPRA